MLLSHPFTTLGRLYNKYYYMYNSSGSTLLKQQLTPNAPLETIRKGVGKQVEIVDGLDDYFLVIESVADQEVTLPDSDPPVTLPYLYFQYALIEKSDYYNSTPNYVPIEGISLKGNA